MLEVVAAALIAPDGRILLQRRRADRQHGGLWEFPGGKLEAGETALHGLIRELDEELGVPLAAGDLVNIHSSTGAKVRKADATTAGKEAHGFVLASVISGGNATVYPEENVISGLTGLTPGTRMFLAATAGLNTATAPSATGQVVQDIGVALSATEILFRPRQPITLA